MQLSHNTSADTNRDAAEPDDVNSRSVPIWSASKLDYRRDHQVSVTLIEGNPQFEETGVDRLRVLALDHVTYTEVIEAEPYVCLIPSNALVFVKMFITYSNFRNDAVNLSDGMVAFISISGVLALVFVYALMKRMEGKTKSSAKHTPINPQHVPSAYCWAITNSPYSATSSIIPPPYTPRHQ